MRGEGFKKGRNRVISFVMAIAMVLTLVTVAPVTAQAAGVTITMHFKNNGWNQVYATIAEGKSWNAISGYGYAKEWPGAEVKQDASNDGWYSFTIAASAGEDFHCIFNNNNNGIQTDNINITSVTTNIEKWVTITDASVANKNVINISDTAPEGWKNSVSEAPVKPVSNVQSPVVNADKTITFNLDATGQYKDATDVKLMGTVTDWTNGLPMKKIGNVFTVTTDKKNPGVYEYKFKYGTNSWICDPANENFIGENSRVVVPGLSVATVEAIAGKAKQLPETLQLYTADGTVTDEKVTYSLKDNSLAENVTLENDTITVKKDLESQHLHYSQLLNQKHQKLQ